MSSFSNFKDILAWQKARELAKDIHHLTSTKEFKQSIFIAGSDEKILRVHYGQYC